MGFKLKNIYAENGKQGDRLLAVIHCSGDWEAQANGSGLYEAKCSYDPNSTPPNIMTFSYVSKPKKPAHDKTWDTKQTLRTKLQDWKLKYPEGEETVEILTTDGGAGDRTLPDPYHWQRILFPWRKYPPRPVFRFKP